MTVPVKEKSAPKNIAETLQNRCGWVGTGKPFYEAYHDYEWGIPVHDDRKLFEMLLLDNAQAGLSWEIILKKREGYRAAFKGFDPKKVAEMSDDELELLLKNGQIVRNRLKVFGARQNARVFLAIQKEFGSFDRYLWSFVNGQPIINHWTELKQIPAVSAESEALSKDLKKRGMSFVGPVIIYAFMQSVGLINDHVTSCFCYGRN